MKTKILAASQVVMILMTVFSCSKNNHKPITNYTKRLEISVKNPVPVPGKNIPIMIPVSKINKNENSSGYGKYSVQEAGNFTTPPFQLDDLNNDGIADEIIFLADLKPGSQKTFYIYYSEKGNLMPQFIKKTDATSLPVWESEFFGYRTYGAFVIDLFGKYKEKPMLSARTYYNHKNQSIYDIHNPGPAGMDILHIGSTLGLGGIFIKDGTNKVEIPRNSQLTVEILASGPVRSVVKMKLSPFETKSGQFRFSRIATIYASEFETHVKDIVETVRLHSTNAKFGIGMRKIKNQKPILKSEEGLIFDWFNQSPEIGETGMGILYETEKVLKISETDENSFIIYNDKLKEGRSITNTFTAFGAWKEGGHIKTEEEFEQFAKAVKRQTIPVKIKSTQVNTTSTNALN